MSATALRPRSATEIVDATFQLMRGHYLQLVVITAVLYAPQIVLQMLLPAPLAPLAGFVALFTNALATGTTILLVSDAYLGRPVDPAASLRTTVRRLLPLIAAAIMQSIFIALGFLLLIVPGFIFLAWVISMVPAIMIERVDSGTAFTRSRELARGMVGHILKSALLLGLIYIAGVVVMGVVVGTLGMDERNLNVASSVLGVFIAPILAVGITLIYYDLRIRKEGFDLEMMAQNLDGGAAAPSRGSAPAASAA